MSIDIRPFNAEENPTPASESSTDTRASEFIDTLRARVTSQDEAQREKWLKAVKPVSKRRRAPVVNPDWLTPNKPAQNAKKPATTQQRPFGTHAKRSAR